MFSLAGISTVEEALESVQCDYKSSNIILDSGDFFEVTFEAEIIEEENSLCLDSK